MCRRATRSSKLQNLVIQSEVIQIRTYGCSLYIYKCITTVKHRYTGPTVKHRYPGPALGGVSPLLFFVNLAVYCCVNLNSCECITPARDPIGSNWLKTNPASTCLYLYQRIFTIHMIIHYVQSYEYIHIYILY